MIDLVGKNPKLLVIGDLIVDHYLWGVCKRISPEAPVQIVDIKKDSIALGGAGNVVHNLSSLGAQVDIISVIGRCDASNEIKQLLGSINVSDQYLFTQMDRITSKKSRIISNHQQVVRFDREINNEINNESQEKILNTFKRIINQYDIILLSDYGKGVLTTNLTKLIISISNENNKKVLVDPKGINYEKYNGAFLLTPNKKEASESTKINIKDKSSLIKAISKLKSQFSLEISIITMSEQGVAVFDNKLRIHPTSAKEVFDVTGAGDTVLASLGFALACDYGIDNAVKFANMAAGIVVGKIGSGTSTLHEIIEYESSLDSTNIGNCIKNFKEIAIISSELRNKGKKIIFSNGCFDLIHVGHIKYLSKAKSFGDILIVGLNSDSSVTSLKGENRPINTELDRAYILAAIEAVDYVVIFKEETPLKLIQNIKPHVLVKGGDYKDKEIVGANQVDEIILVDYIDGHSSTIIIDKIAKRS